MRLPMLLSGLSCGLLLSGCAQSGSPFAPVASSPSQQTGSRSGIRGGASTPAYKFRVIVNFTGVNGLNPVDNLTADAAGNLYGTTTNGFHRDGTLFELSGARTLHTLYNFNTNLLEPGADAVMDKGGNLYGTTMENQGSSDSTYGGIYRVSSKGIETVLHSFSGGADGGLPFSNLVFGPNGDLYGTTSLGGDSQGTCAPGGCGVVFKITTAGKYSVVHAFGPSDGNEPYAGVTFDSQGNLYGTTQFGGTAGWGTVFKIDTSGKETILYNFTDGADGGWPTGGLVFDASGNIYGTASSGGKNQSCESGACGVVFKLSSSDQETTLHEFGGGSDGAQPIAGVIVDSSGNLYGTTRAGGNKKQDGIAYEISTSGQNYTILHVFGQHSGSEPMGALYLNAAGDLYGTTNYDGKGEGGTVYELTPTSQGARR